MAANRDEVAALLGELDPFMMERILAVGASIDEVDEALRASEDERGFGDEPHPASSPRVTEVRAVLDELAADDEAAGPDESRQ